MTEREIFAQALEIQSASARSAFLDKACGGDAALRERVVNLLTEQENLGSYLEVPAAAVVTIDQPAIQRPGMRIGRFRLLEQIGEGGMGTVWVAEQTEPVKRRVALKLIKPGMDSRQVLSRFEAERQALALMDHPNIAKFIDAGMVGEGQKDEGGRTKDERQSSGSSFSLHRSSFPSGRPYFVMEYVKGVPITEFCDNARLSIPERLKLFVAVCQAVQHAHQKGVIHRDLKPSNILVCLYDGVPVPKVIDFGLAKAISQPLTEHTLYTAHGLMVGTPLYMSPEQAEFNNLDVDTRSDIYSLGVLLYELLTGTTPLEKQQFKDAALNEILRLIKEVDPPKPSAKISSLSRVGSAHQRAGSNEPRPTTPDESGRHSPPNGSSLENIAAQRSLEPAQLTRAIRGDLDWIVMKALEKDRSRRYETANGLARDLQRHLHDEPVEAGPPSATYLVRKLLQRHRIAVAMAATIIGSLVLGMIGMAWQAHRARQAEQAALEEKQMSDEQRDRAVKAEQLAQARLENEEQERARAERAEAEARQQAEKARNEAAIAQGVVDFINTDLLAQADPNAEPDRNVMLRTVLDRAAENIARRFDNQPLVKAAIHHTLGETYLSLGDNEKAERNLSSAHALRTDTLGAEDRQSIHSIRRLARSIRGQGRAVEAEQLLRPVLESCERTFGPEDETTAYVRNEYAAALHSQGRIREAEPHYRRALDVFRRTKGEENTTTGALMHNLAIVLGRQDRKVEESKSLHKQTVAIYEKVLGPDHLGMSEALFWYGWTLTRIGEYEEAAVVQKRAAEIRMRVLGPSHQATVDSQFAVVRAYCNLGQEIEAAEAYRQFLAAESDPTSALQRGTYLLRLGHWIPACDDLFRETRFDGATGALKVWVDPVHAIRYGALLRVTGQSERFSAFCRMAAQDWSLSDPTQVLWLVTMSPDTTVDRDELLRLATTVIEAKDQPWTRFLAAVAYYRRGEFQRALAALDQARIGGKFARYAEFVRAMMEHQIGNARGAKDRLVKAEGGYHELCLQCLETLSPEQAHNGQWWLVAYTQIMRREAWLLIHGRNPPDDEWQRELEATLVESGAARAAFDRLLLADSANAARYYERRAALLLGWKKWSEAIAALDQAVASAKDGTESTDAMLLRAKMWTKQDDYHRAATYYVQLLDRLPELERPPILERIIESNELYAQVIKLRPNSPVLYRARGAEHGRNGRWEQSLADYEQALQLTPNDRFSRLLVAMLSLEIGDSAKCQRACQEALGRSRNATVPIELDRIAKTCLLVPAAPYDWGQVQSLADRAVAAAVDPRFRRWCRVSQGLAAYRRGKHSESIEFIRPCLDQKGDPIYLSAIALLVQGMAQFQLDQPENAAASLERARLMIVAVPPPVEEPLDENLWHEWLRYRILRREADALMGSNPRNGGPRSRNRRSRNRD